MGMKWPRSENREGDPGAAARLGPGEGQAVIEALFSLTQQRLLELLFGQPDRGFYINELMARTGSGAGAAHRELARLERAGLLRSCRNRGRKLFRADPQSVVHSELVALFRKTTGLAAPLREAIAPYTAGVEAAFVYLSPWQSFDARPRLMHLALVGQDIQEAQLGQAAAAASARMGREFFTYALDPEDLQREPGWYYAQIFAQPAIWLFRGQG